MQVTSLRSEEAGYIDNSFPTIAGFRSNGAIVHYRAEPNSALTIDPNGLLLIDSGAATQRETFAASSIAVDASRGIARARLRTMGRVEGNVAKNSAKEWTLETAGDECFRRRRERGARRGTLSIL